MNTEKTLQEINEKLDAIKGLTAVGNKSVLRVEEAALLTGYTVGHLYRLTSTKQIPHYKHGRDLFFRKDELEDWLTAKPVKTDAEIDSLATTYIATR